MMIPMRQRFAEKTEKQKIDAAIELSYWSDSDNRSLGSITDTRT